MALPPSSTAPPPQAAQAHHRSAALYPIAARNHTSCPSSSIGISIRVAFKSEYRFTPPPHLSPQIGDSPRSDFDFDFDVERKILVEAEKDSPNWSGLALGDIPQETPDQTDPVKEFADQFTRLKDMGFSSNNVAEALLTFDNDIDKALQDLLNHPS